MTTVTAGSVLLPRRDGSLVPYVPSEPRTFPRPAQPLESRVFFAAAHVVSDPLAEPDGTADTRLDWELTLAFRRHLWSYGLGVAEAMDTAQRGSGLGWPAARELIRRSAAEARSVGGRIAAGAGTDQLPPGLATLDRVEQAYLEQCTFVEGQGVQVILMASRALAAAGRDPDDYRRVYRTVLEQVREPVIIHWLGDMFDPQLAGYWGSRDPHEEMDVVVALATEHADRIDGIKISLLEAGHEIELRRRVPDRVRVYTGDDSTIPR